MLVPMGIPICPITQEPMVEPVIDPEGISYEKAAILAALAIKTESPITRSALTPDQLIPNRALIDAIALLSMQNIPRNREKNITECSKCNKSIALSENYKGKKQPTCFNCRPWNCKTCTFTNVSEVNACSMCMASRN